MASLSVIGGGRIVQGRWAATHFSRWVLPERPVSSNGFQLGCRYTFRLFLLAQPASRRLSTPPRPRRPHHRCAHAPPSVAGRVQVTFSGIGPLGSHGCSFTASATFQVPRSITPSAAQPRRKPTLLPGRSGGVG